MTGAGISLRGVAKRYGDVTALHPLDLEVEGGTLVTLLGPSGCGKTTLLRLVAGLETASEGAILIGGRDVTRLPAGERNVSMVFQSYALFPHMTVRENVAYGLVSSGLGKREAVQRAEAALESVGLAGFGARMPSEVSGGQQQRVAVARALVLEPQVLLLDEPLSNLDARLRRSMREDIRALQQRLSLTCLYVTHDQQEALAVSDRIVVMRDGRVAQAGTPEELYTRPNSLFVAGFMGDANQLRGVLAADGTLQIGPLRLQVVAEGVAPGELDVVVRPEAIRFATAGLPARVRRASYMGPAAEYLFDTELGEVFAVMPGGWTLVCVSSPSCSCVQAVGCFWACR